MKDLPRTDRFRKDESREALLRRANELLAGLDAKLDEACAPQRPVIFIIGPPQSATTLVSQLFASAGCFGFISNFTARFYSAPALGMLLEQALGLDTEQATGYESEYGVTKGWRSPHEFGYFWNRWFDQGQETHKLTPDKLARVDGAGLRSAVAHMEAVTGAPMIFKNNTWCTFQIAFLKAIFPKSIWVVCQRHPFYNAQAITNGRKNRHGNINTWWSVRPTQYPSLVKLPWYSQVAGQVRHTLDEMEEGLKSIAPPDIVRVRYEDLCRKPWDPIQRVAMRLREYDEILEPTLPNQALTCQDVPELQQPELHQLEQACIKWFGTCYNGWNMPFGLQPPQLERL